MDVPVALLTSKPYPTEALSSDGLVAWLAQTGRELPFILEPRLAAHPDLAVLVGTGTLPTLRVVTIADAGGACAPLYVYLRMATTDCSVDNISTGGLAGLIDSATGTLLSATTSVGGTMDVHPLTGRPLVGARIPMVNLACRQSLQMHAALIACQDVPVPVVGWDVAVTSDGPAFIEGNILSDLSTPQKLLNTGAWTDARFERASCPG